MQDLHRREQGCRRQTLERRRLGDAYDLFPLTEGCRSMRGQQTPVGGRAMASTPARIPVACSSNSSRPAGR
jgi:hypothetical protein